MKEKRKNFDGEEKEKNEIKETHEVFFIFFFCTVKNYTSI